MSISSPFKNELKKSWADWFKSSVPVYTNAGNRKHPDYETMIELVNAMKSKTPDVIRTSFRTRFVLLLLMAKMSLLMN